MDDVRGGFTGQVVLEVDPGGRGEGDGEVVVPPLMGIRSHG